MNVDKISPEFATALLQAQKSMNPVAKKKVNPAFKSKYATLGDCQEAITEPLNDNDIVYLCPLVSHEGFVGATPTVIFAKTGEILTSEGFYLAVAKNDPQGHGSAGTYVQRYATLAWFALPTEDDDANKAQPTRPAYAPQQAPVRPPIAQPTNAVLPKPVPQTTQVKLPVDQNGPATPAAITAFVKLFKEKNPEEDVNEDNLKKLTQAAITAAYKELQAK